jgi:hypothetical protein
MPVLHVLLPTWHVPKPLRGAELPRPAVADGAVVVETLLIAPHRRPRLSTATCGASPLRQWLMGLWLAGVVARLPAAGRAVRLRLLLARSARSPMARGHRAGPVGRQRHPGCGASVRRSEGPRLLMTGRLPSGAAGSARCDTWSTVYRVVRHEAEQSSARDWLLQLAAELPRAPRLVQSAGLAGGSRLRSNASARVTTPSWHAASPHRTTPTCRPARTLTGPRCGCPRPPWRAPRVSKGESQPCRSTHRQASGHQVRPHGLATPGCSPPWRWRPSPRSLVRHLLRQRPRSAGRHGAGVTSP